MAKRGSNKDRSVRQEELVARVYGGTRSKSSGAAVTDQGDVRTYYTLFECKTTGKPGKESKSTLVRRMEKIADEAWEEGKEPALALQFYMPDSPLAGEDGYVNLSVRLMMDDAARFDLKSQNNVVEQNPWPSWDPNHHAWNRERGR